MGFSYTFVTQHERQLCCWGRSRQNLKLTLLWIYSTLGLPLTF